MSSNMPLSVRKVAVVAGLSALAACATPAPPPPPPPPPPVKPIAIPSRPLPPGGAARSLVIPAKDASGVRLTVNAHISPLEAVWNFRSGWNVAALNCLEPKYRPILAGYTQFLDRHSKRLSAVNRELDRDYRKKLGSQAVRARESYNTKVYNYFALPPAHEYFCDAALEISQQALSAPPADPDAFALAALPRLEAAFGRFYDDMERYWIAVADWDARYGNAYGRGAGAAYASAPVNVTYGEQAAVQLSAPYANGAEGAPAASVSQPGSGAGAVSQPVVQPLPAGEGS